MCATNYKCSGLFSIQIPDAVTSIEEMAFCGCSINEISIPNSVTTIEKKVFKDCHYLIHVDIPNSVKIIEESAFENCVNFEVELPNSVTSIGDYAFCGCTGMTSINLPNSLLGIHRGAFERCTNLTSLSIPGSVTWIYGRAFYGCSSITSIVFQSSASSIGVEESAFEGCKGLKTVIINDRKSYTFADAFKRCDNITDVYIYSDKYVSAWSSCFADCYIEYSKLHVPSSLIGEYKTKSPWSGFGEFISIDDDPNRNESYDIVDKENYLGSQNIQYETITYTRNFPEETVGTWQAMYLPISINVEDYKDDFDIAEIYAFSPYRDTNGDGVLDGDDDNFMFVSIKKTGSTKPNLPYSIRPKHSGNITINSDDGVLHAAAERELVMATTRNIITISGLYREKTLVAGDGNYYVAIDGTLCNTTSSTSIKANRWVMNMKSRDYGDIVLSPNYNVKQIGILAVGEDVDEETAIELIRANSVESTSMANGIYTIDGRNVSNVQKLPAGMYIKNGKKFIVK